MWTKTIHTKFKNTPCQVQIWLDTENDDSKPVVKVQSMYCEWFLSEEIIFEKRDNAYDFIKHYPVSMANAFIVREVYYNGAVE